MASASEALRDAEIALRDFVADILEEKFGDKWIENCGVTPERIEKWQGRKEEEGKRRTSGYIDERLLYYSDISDLKTIISKHGELFKPVFKDKKQMEVYLDKMEVYLDKIETYRHPTAHHREYLPHEADLVKGISGEIRAMISAYKRGKSEDAEYFPTIEYIRDSFGNVIRKKGNRVDYHLPQILRPGDTVEFVVKAWDPFDELLEYQININWPSLPPGKWTENNSLRWEVNQSDIGKSTAINIQIRSKREWHAAGFYDDGILLYYKVLPEEKPK